jgi:(R)-2-hydroxyacyl-CoA dehydratese activating ATPase
MIAKQSLVRPIIRNPGKHKEIHIFTIGIDAGMEITKAVILKEKDITAWAAIPGGRESTAQVARRALDQVIERAGAAERDVGTIVATGLGRDYVTFTKQKQPEFLCLACGINFLMPSARILLDLGTRKSIAIKCLGGKALKLAPSSKCAAGTGTYLKMVADIFNLTLEQMSELSFKSKTDIEIQTTCAVFAESEIISLIHNGAREEDILKGVFRGLAERLYPQLLEIGIEKEIAITGGFARNKAIIAALEVAVGFPLLVPENPIITGALGAALIGQRKRSEKA